MKKILALSILMMFSQVSQAELVYIDEESIIEVPAFTSQAALNRINPEPIIPEVVEEVQVEKRIVTIAEISALLKEKAKLLPKHETSTRNKKRAFTMETLEAACGHEFRLDAIVFAKKPAVGVSHILCEKK